MKSFLLAALFLAGLVLGTFDAMAGDESGSAGTLALPETSGCDAAYHVADAKPESRVSVDPLRPQTLAAAAAEHGTWHPCKDDPNACGAGHVCCSGHCIKGDTCGR